MPIHYRLASWVITILFKYFSQNNLIHSLLSMRNLSLAWTPFEITTIQSWNAGVREGDRIPSFFCVWRTLQPLNRPVILEFTLFANHYFCSPHNLAQIFKTLLYINTLAFENIHTYMHKPKYTGASSELANQSLQRCFGFFGVDQ